MLWPSQRDIVRWSYTVGILQCPQCHIVRHTSHPPVLMGPGVGRGNVLSPRDVRSSRSQMSRLPLRLL